jgi:four helix bundle protein
MGRRKGDDIADRLLNLGAAVVKLLPALGKRPGGKAIVKQLEPEWTKASSASSAGRSPRRSTSTGSTEPARSERCGPAGGSNYEEARGAESPADFVHKTRIALKEVRETRYWLRLAARAELLERTQHLATLIDEADQLVAILTASANTARQRAGC